MSDAASTTSELMRMKQAIISMRQAFITQLDEVESAIDILLPPEDPPPTPRRYDINYLRSLGNHTKGRKSKEIIKSR